jgi:hypothetical protein
MLSRPTVDVPNVIYGLTSSDCTTANHGVTKGGQCGLPDRGGREEGLLMLSRPTVDVRNVIYGLTSSDCTTTNPGVMKGGQVGLQDSGEK